jgi:hypothetical protein
MNMKIMALSLIQFGFNFLSVVPSRSLLTGGERDRVRGIPLV